MALRQALRALGPLLRLGGGGAQAGGGGRGWGVRSLRNMSAAADTSEEEERGGSEDNDEGEDEGEALDEDALAAAHDEAVAAYMEPEGDAPRPPRRIARTLTSTSSDSKSKSKANLPSLSIAEAIASVKANTKGKNQKRFVQAIDIAVRLGLDPKRSDMLVRGVVNLPHGTGKKIRVCVFAEGEQADEARAAGADVVGGDELIAAIKANGVAAIDFDKAIAHPAIMPKLAAIARVLGPRGMMPNPKVGTLTANITAAVAAMRLGRVEFRAEKNAIVHACVGKANFDDAHLEANVAAFMAAIIELRPKGIKGAPSATNYLMGASLSSTMGKGSFRIQKEALVKAAADAGKL